MLKHHLVFKNKKSLHWHYWRTHTNVIAFFEEQTNHHPPVIEPANDGVPLSPLEGHQLGRLRGTEAGKEENI